MDSFNIETLPPIDEGDLRFEPEGYSSEEDFGFYQENEEGDQEVFSPISEALQYPYINLGSLSAERYKLEVLSAMVRPVKGLVKPIRIMATVSGLAKDIGSISGSQVMHLIDLLGIEAIESAHLDAHTPLLGDDIYVLAY